MTMTKRILTIATAIALTTAAYAQAIYQPGQHDNVVTVVAEDSAEELERYPLQITLTNPTISIAGISAYLYIDDNSIQPWVFDEDEDSYVYEINKDRCYSKSNVQTFICDATNPNYPGYFFVDINYTKDFKLTEGTIITLYIDATKLSDGKHTIHVVDPMSVYASADGSESASYFNANQEIYFEKAGGTLTIVNSISDIMRSNTFTDKTFDLHGRAAAANETSVMIKNGKKVIGIH